MAKKVTWAFIFRSDNANSEVDKAVMLHDGNRLLTYGCNTIEEGVAVAKRIVEEEDCLLIELCGGFGKDGAQKVIEGIGGKVPVGYITYPESEIPKLSILD